jgi:hypothetical protein
MERSGFEYFSFEMILSINISYECSIIAVLYLNSQDDQDEISAVSRTMLRSARPICDTLTARYSWFVGIAKIINIRFSILPSAIRRRVLGTKCITHLLLFFQTHSISIVADVWATTESGNQLEVATIICSSCCLSLCSGSLAVSTTNNVLIGTIKKLGNSCCSQPFLVI